MPPRGSAGRTFAVPLGPIFPIARCSCSPGILWTRSDRPHRGGTSGALCSDRACNLAGHAWVPSAGRHVAQGPHTTRGCLCPDRFGVAEGGARLRGQSAALALATRGGRVAPADDVLASATVPYPWSRSKDPTRTRPAGHARGVRAASLHRAARAGGARRLEGLGSRACQGLPAGSLCGCRSQQCLGADAAQSSGLAPAPRARVDGATQLCLSRLRGNDTRFAIVPTGVP